MDNQEFVISDRTIADFLACPYKAYLRIINHTPRPSKFMELQAQVQDNYANQAQIFLTTTLARITNLHNSILTQPQIMEEYDLIVGASLQVGDCISSPPALQRLRPHERPTPAYAPIRFAHGLHPTNIDRILVTYDSLLLARLLNSSLSDGAIIYSNDYRRTTVRVAAHLTRLQRLISWLREQTQGLREPAHILNRHCDICEFQSHCWAKARAADHLSLLHGISEAEIARHGEKGVFTVHQLSYTFRSRKPRKRAKHPANPHHFALQALALREGKVFVHGTPRLPQTENRIYLDIEGLNDRRFYYLIGVGVTEDGHTHHRHYWADTPTDQLRIFRDLLDDLRQYEGWPLFHFGDYETKALKRIRPHLNEGQAHAIDRILQTSVNILSVIRPHIYFPVYSNRLKDIAHHLSYRWTAASASGQTAVCWRLRWEATGRQSLKSQLVEYNRQDCDALRHVVNFIYAACRKLDAKDPDQPSNDGVVDTASLNPQPPRRHKFGKPEFVFSDWTNINRSSYFDYQRQHVYVRADKAFRAITRRPASHHHVRRHRPTAIYELVCKKCLRCRSRALLLQARRKREIIDIKFYSTGARRWIGQYAIFRYHCRKCGETFNHPDAPTLRTKFGHGLMSWFIYQHFVGGQNMMQIHKGLHEVFGLQLSYPQLHRLKARAAGFYAETYASLQKDIVGSPVLHVDETAVNLRGRHGHVWVLANRTKVYYFYRESREAGFLAELLGDFSGVLVSDFFTGYDALKCAQQKCLVHLLRDINEDLLRRPFDDELKLFGHHFGLLLRDIVQTVDKYGLKRRHLQKHRKEVTRFVEALCSQHVTSAALERYQKRFRRGGDKMFNFLNYDGVPWNNNNAEHAIKAFARYRRFSDGRFTEDSLADFLLLLSVVQSCEYSGVGVLKFLLSGEVVIPSARSTKGSPDARVCEGSSDVGRW